MPTKKPVAPPLIPPAHKGHHLFSIALVWRAGGRCEVFDFENPVPSLVTTHTVLTCCQTGRKARPGLNSGRSSILFIPRSRSSK